MSAEFLKLRALMTPRLVLAAVLAVIAVAGLITFFVEPEDHTLYHQAPIITATVALELGAIVLGVWIIAMEFGQGTVRRLLTAEPRRPRIVANKLATLAAALLGLCVLGGLLGFWVGALGAHFRDVDYDAGTAAKLAVVAGLSGFLAGILSFALGLLAESMAGGIVLAFALLFVLDGVVSFVGPIQDYTFNSALNSIANRIDPSQSAALALGPAIAVALGWVVVFLVPGVVRFVRSDFK